MLKSDPDDIVLGQVGSNRGHTLTNKVRLVRFVSVSAHSVFVGIDGHGRHGKLVGSTEDTDGNLPSISHKELFERARMAGLFLSEASDTVENRRWLATPWVTECNFGGSLRVGNNRCTRRAGSTWSGGIDAEVGNPGFDLLVNERCIMMERYTIHISFGQNVDSSW